MKLSEMFEKLENSPEFKKFHKQNQKAYFCAAFFVFDYDNNEEKKQLDYFISEDKGIMTFLVDEKVIAQKADMVKKEKLKEIKNEEIKIELDKIVEMAKKEAERQNFRPSKIIAILQRLVDDERLIWNLTLLSGFSILRMHVDMSGKTILNEKKSMLDIMKIEKGAGSARPGSTPKKDAADYVG